jgi:hypothetical protein
LISALIPWLIIPLLMVGGAYLCFEGVEKVVHKLFHQQQEAQQKQAVLQALRDPKIDLAAFEQNKIKGAIRTDFILSAEIIVIALGTVAEAPLATQTGVVAGIALLMTVGVYGLVAAIVKLDDAGLHLVEKSSKGLWGGLKQKLGRGLLVFAPWLMKTLAVVGTLAMFLVGGGILIHGVPFLTDWEHSLVLWAETFTSAGFLLKHLVSLVFSAGIGVIAGSLVLAVVALLSRFSKGGNE